MKVRTDPTTRPPETLRLTVEEPDLGFTRAKEIAKAAALERASDAMLLSWNDKVRGEFHPTVDCGGRPDPPWIVYAESRGANLTVDINDGDYTFLFLAF